MVEEGPALSSLRHSIFVLEQKCHRKSKSIRLTPDIYTPLRATAMGAHWRGVSFRASSRVSAAWRVVRSWRRSGVGAQILKLLCEEAKRRGYAEVMLHSQTRDPVLFPSRVLSHGAGFLKRGFRIRRCARSCKHLGGVDFRHPIRQRQQIQRCTIASAQDPARIDSICATTSISVIPSARNTASAT